MAENKLVIPVSLPNKTVELTLYGENSGQTVIEKDDAIENGEARYQIIEGCYYEYKISHGYSLSAPDVVSQSKVNDSSGRISPNIYVGTLTLDVLDADKNKCGEVKIEVQSKKTTYRHDYRHMLEEITEKCTDLLLQHSSPVSQYFEVDPNADASTLYQRFAFIKSILESVEFNDSVHKIISISKGYYLIISSQYASRGILPPGIFLDGLMKYYNRHYYLALLNAAVFHGASHQQPQEFFVITGFPQMRVINKKGIKINYISRKTISEKYTESRKTESGYIKISSPILTATDLIQFQKRVGGLSRVATVLEELADAIKPETITEDFVKEIPLVTLQRLGYILDKILGKEIIAERLYNICIKAKLKFNRKPLSESGKRKGFLFDEKWKLIINTEVEPDI